MIPLAIRSRRVYNDPEKIPESEPFPGRNEKENPP